MGAPGGVRRASGGRTGAERRGRSRRRGRGPRAGVWRGGRATDKCRRTMAISPRATASMAKAQSVVTSQSRWLRASLARTPVNVWRRRRTPQALKRVCSTVARAADSSRVTCHCWPGRTRRKEKAGEPARAAVHSTSPWRPSWRMRSWARTRGVRGGGAGDGVGGLGYLAVGPEFGEGPGVVQQQAGEGEQPEEEEEVETEIVVRPAVGGAEGFRR